MKKLVLLLIFILFLTQVNAQELQLNYNIEYSKVLVDYKFYTTEAFDLELPSDASTFSYSVDKQFITLDKTENILHIPKAQEIELSYLTKLPLESSGSNTFFLMDLNLPISIQSKIKLTLPENAVLSKAIDQSIFPATKKVSTDGQHIIIEWDKNLESSKSFSIFVIFKEKKTYWWILIPFILIIIILVILLSKKPKIKKIIQKQPVKLKPDEQRIIDILKKKNGECEQATLRLITDFSKASLSRILKELEQRGIIKKLASGKKNIIALK